MYEDTIIVIKPTKNTFVHSRARAAVGKLKTENPCLSDSRLSLSILVYFYANFLPI